MVITPEKSGFFQSVARRDRASILKHYSPVQKVAMDSLSGMTGGYLVPESISYALMEGLAERSVIRPRALVVPMTTRTISLPMPSTGSGTTAYGAGVSPFFGGMTFSWLGGEGVALTETEPTFREGKLVARDLIGYAVVSNQLVQDIGAEGELALARLFGRAAAWAEEYGFLRGTGTGTLQPMGILNANCAIDITRAGSNAISQVDIAKMTAKLIPGGWAASIWMTHPTTLEKIMGLSTWIPNANPLGSEFGAVGTLMTRPLFVTEKLPPLGTRGDLIFFDPSAYVIGDRQQIMIEASDQVRFSTFQTVFKVWVRVDGQPVLSDKVILADGAETASSIVVLN